MTQYLNALKGRLGSRFDALMARGSDMDSEVAVQAALEINLARA